MKGNERLKLFLELQNKNINIDDIAKQLGITTKTLRGFLNKNGYKLENNKYVLKDKNNLSQISFIEIDSKEKKDIKKTSKKNLVTKKNTKNENNKLKKDEEKIKDIANKKVNKKNKKDRKINLTQEDMDKLCEVYDWYLQVRDNKNMKPKKITSNKKDINIEEKELKELKSTSIKVDKSTWEEFERLCSNSNFSKQQIITQALKDFMKEYKHLL
jgi:hypothetical protein